METLLTYSIGGHTFTANYSHRTRLVSFKAGGELLACNPPALWDDVMGEMDLYRDKLASLIPGYLVEVKGKKNP